MTQKYSKGPWIERLLFSARPLIVLFFVLLTGFFGYHASQIKPDAAFEKMIPTSHPYIANYLKNKEELKGLGNAVRIAVETTGEDIFTAEFQETLRQIHEEVFYIPGVERSALLSIWASAVRWNEVTEEGFAGGPVIADTYDGSAAELEQMRTNVIKSGTVGALVGNNFKSAVIYAPLMDINPETGKPIDYQVFATQLEELVRSKYQTEDIKIHITGFAKVVGDLIDGASQVGLFFLVALVITLVLLYGYSRCGLSAVIPLLCSVIAVVWQLGALRALGYGLDPFSMLVPFLVFAIAVSHGVQIINAIAHERANGHSKQMSARLAFRALYIPGMIALVSDGVGFATLHIIDIQVIRDLALAAAIGVAIIILTNLVLLPILMSYTGVSDKSVTRQQYIEERGKHPVWEALAGLTEKRRALTMVGLAALLTVFGLYQSQDLKIGDLDAGAPELRPDSRYNQDIAFITANYATSTDIFVVMVETAADQCVNYNTLDAVDQLQWRVRQVPGVQSSTSLVDEIKKVMAGNNEGNIKWTALNRNQVLMDQASIRIPRSSYNADCSLAPVLFYLNDHKAETLTAVVNAVEEFAAEFNSDDLKITLAAGNAGIEAATNMEIEKAQTQMLIFVYLVVAVLCMMTFRSIRTVICIILPLAMTSILCQALMANLGIGVKVATLPVIGLGVGIGVDYGIYIYSKLQTYLDDGVDLRTAYFNTLKTTGKAVAFTGVTLGIGVCTWVVSPIKFQADMGILLTFMFIWNMIGALILIPALASLLIKPKAKEVAPKVTGTKGKDKAEEVNLTPATSV